MRLKYGTKRGFPERKKPFSIKNIPKNGRHGLIYGTKNLGFIKRINGYLQAKKCQSVRFSSLFF